jgi:hypothetical protein
MIEVKHCELGSIADQAEQGLRLDAADIDGDLSDIWIRLVQPYPYASADGPKYAHPAGPVFGILFPEPCSHKQQIHSVPMAGRPRQDCQCVAGADWNSVLLAGAIDPIA